VGGFAADQVRGKPKDQNRSQEKRILQHVLTVGKKTREYLLLRCALDFKPDQKIGHRKEKAAGKTHKDEREKGRDWPVRRAGRLRPVDTGALERPNNVNSVGWGGKEWGKELDGGQGEEKGEECKNPTNSITRILVAQTSEAGE